MKLAPQSIDLTNRNQAESNLLWKSKAMNMPAITRDYREEGLMCPTWGGGLKWSRPLG